MKKKIIGIFVMTLLIGPAVLSVSACTGFTASDGEKVLVGTNMDWSQGFNMFLNFFPAEEGKYGRVTIDFHFPFDLEPFPYDPNYIVPKEGMNDQGLFCSIFITPYLFAKNSKDKPIFYSDDPDYYKYAFWTAYCLAKCSNVSEVLDVFDDYNLEYMAGFQAFYADRHGDSLIIEGDDIVYREGDFQVITNFIQTHPELGWYPCWRYNTAVSMLENMTNLSVDYFRSICNATTQRTTVQSYVYDLRQEKIWINYMQDFNKVVEIDLNEELVKGRNRIYIGSLFEPEGNQGPGIPEAPTGDISGSPGEIYSYSIRKIKDPDGDQLSYKWDWGDGNFSQWITAPKTGMYLSADYNWSEEGTYEVRVKAMDMYGCEGEWSDPLVVSMPKNKSINLFNPWFLRLIQRFPYLKYII
jgi:choloylglycine hydrolase